MVSRQLQGNCPYCKYPILEEEDYLICPGCEVPHHSDCWQQNRGCATFACTGERTANHGLDLNDYSFDDLADDYACNRFVIELEDLPEENDFTSTTTLGVENNRGNQQVAYGISSNAKAIQLLAWAGIIAGILIYTVSGNIFNFELYADYRSFDMVLVEILAFASVMGGIIGLCLGSVEGISCKVNAKIFLGALSGMGLGVLGAVIGVILGQGIYVLISSQPDGFILLLVARAIHWGLVGLFVGLGQGLANGGGTRIFNGMLGGAIGGFVGGVMFDSIFTFLSSASLSAFVAISTFCLCISISIGLVQELRKEAWLQAIHGATAGKEYIIHKSRMSIGSNPRSDIVLVMDRSVANNHAIIYLDQHYYIEPLLDSHGVYVNDNLVRSRRLNCGDQLRIGNYKLVFYEKSV